VSTLTPTERGATRTTNLSPGTSLDRAVGALLGLAAGDAVGTTLEFKSPGSFAPIDDMVGGGPFALRPGQWTDDTSMALCLAESILDRSGLDPADQLRRYLLWKDEGYLSSTGTCFDIGNTTRAALERFRRTGATVDDPVIDGAAANGSLMRLAAVPIRYHADVEAAAEASAESSRTTHGAARPVDACRVLGAMTAALIAGRPAGEVLTPDFWTFGPLHPAVEAVARGSWQRRQPPEIRGSGYSVAALEAALWAVDGASSFAEAVLRAANLGDDADTTAAIAGQLAGARWGASGIPGRWRDLITSADRIVSLAGALHAEAVGRDPASAWDHEDTVHGWWVEPGLLAGEYPGSPDPWRARDKVNVLVDAGVRTFIDLTTPADGMKPYGHLVADAARTRALDLRHERFPIPDLGIVDDATYDDVLRMITQAKERGTVYVHCWGGVGRTGTVVGCHLAAQGHDYDSILTKIDTLRAKTKKAGRRSPETQVQLDLLRRRTGPPGNA